LLTLVLSAENKFAVKLAKTNADRNPMPICPSDDFDESDYLLAVKGVRDM
jgi:hypothetical protein